MAARLLFTVQSVVEIPGKGLLLGPGVLAKEGVAAGDTVELRSADGKTTQQVEVKAIAFLSPSPGDPPAVPILVGAKQKDVPVGTQVWAP